MAEWEFDIEGDYGHGWELVTCEETKADAVAMRDLYRENEPGVAFRIRRVRREA
jgi:hypothetical protein